MGWRPDYITVAEFNAFTRTADTLDDAETAVWITAASRSIDEHCHRQFGLSVGHARVYRRAPFYDPMLGLWCVDIDDLPDATGLMIGGVPFADLGAVVLPENAIIDGTPATRLGFPDAAPEMPLIVDAQAWGWLSIPIQVKGAARLQTNRFAARRDSVYGVTETPEGASPLRLQARVDPDVANALRGLGRLEWPR